VHTRLTDHAFGPFQVLVNRIRGHGFMDAIIAMKSDKRSKSPETNPCIRSPRSAVYPQMLEGFPGFGMYSAWVPSCCKWTKLHNRLRRLSSRRMYIPVSCRPNLQRSFAQDISCAFGYVVGLGWLMWFLLEKSLTGTPIRWWRGPEPDSRL
jgi:hypothetical protein